MEQANIVGCVPIEAAYFPLNEYFLKQSYCRVFGRHADALPNTRSKKKEGTSSHVAQLNDHSEHLSIRNNNANNKSEKDGGKNQPEANHHQQQKQEQHPDANSKGKGTMGEGGKGKEIKLGGTNENMNRKGESGQMGQRPRDLTRNESNQMGQVGQYSRGEIPVYDQNDQRGQYPRGHTETTDYGQTYHTNMHPMSQGDQMEGGYYRRQPAFISPFSDEPTADGGCSIM
ncbi:hypothetical protein ACLB2K_064914 [Fragaria x ananassa]